VETALKEAGITADDKAVRGLFDEAHDHAVRVQLERDQRKRLDATGRPTATLPYAHDGIDLGTLYDFADILRSAEIV